MGIMVSKIEVARKQLKAGIHLLFNGGDPVAAHTLISAAATIVSDLVENKCPDDNWNSMAREATGLSLKDYYSVMRAAQNFFKHADNDPNDALEFNQDDTYACLFAISFDLRELEKVMPIELTSEELRLPLWYLACCGPIIDEKSKLFPSYEYAIQMFGDLHNKPREEKLAAGRAFLE